MEPRDYRIRNLTLAFGVVWSIWTVLLIDDALRELKSREHRESHVSLQQFGPRGGAEEE